VNDFQKSGFKPKKEGRISRIEVGTAMGRIRIKLAPPQKDEGPFHVDGVALLKLNGAKDPGTKNGQERQQDGESQNSQ
jgi:hypothetical protein